MLAPGRSRKPQPMAAAPAGRDRTGRPSDGVGPDEVWKTPADQLLTQARALGYERRDIAALYEVIAHLASDPTASPA